MQNKKLYRSNVNCMLAGVCGGLGEYFNRQCEIKSVNTDLL